MWWWFVAVLTTTQSEEICFNGCSGHGTCRDFMCTCDPGWDGDDCSHALTSSSEIVPILTAGHFNVTAKNLTAAARKLSLMLVGFSSRTCHKCIAAERQCVEATTSE